MCAKLHHSCPTLYDPLDHQAPLSMGFPGKNTGVGFHAFLQGSSLPGIEPRSLTSPALVGRFLTTSSVQFSSVTQSCPTLCNPMNRSMPGLPVHHQLPEFTQTHVYLVGDATQPFHPLSSPSPPAPNLPQHQGLFKCVSSSHQVAKVLEFHLEHQSFQ